jgi:hypothetical protein
MQRADRHRSLVAELLSLFLERGFTILAADGVKGYPQPTRLRNDGYGDQESKAPDIYAYDEKQKRFVIGEAKTGDADFETEHSLTQYNVFLDQFDSSTGMQAQLFVIVPADKIAEFNTLITHYIHRDYWSSIVLVSSKSSLA